MSLYNILFDTRRRYTTRWGISVENIREKGRVTISGYILIQQNCQVLLSREFAGTMDVVCDYFDLPHERAMDNLTHELLWDHFEQGQFTLICKVGKRKFYFQVEKGNVGTHYSFWSDDQPTAPARLSGYDLIEPDDFLTFCKFRAVQNITSQYDPETLQRAIFQQKAGLTTSVKSMLEKMSQIFLCFRKR